MHLVAHALGAKLDPCACIPRGPRQASLHLGEEVARQMRRATTAVFDRSGRDTRMSEEHPNNRLVEMQAPQTGATPKEGVTEGADAA